MKIAASACFRGVGRGRLSCETDAGEVVPGDSAFTDCADQLGRPPAGAASLHNSNPSRSTVNGKARGRPAGRSRYILF
jgi:hypothetical protein